MSFVSSAAFGLAGLTRSPTALMSGTSWRNEPSHFAASTLLRKATLVTLLPGRLRVATRPALTGSVPIVKTTGMTVVYLVLGYISVGPFIVAVLVVVVVSGWEAL